jgi:hypothetical protein
MSTEQCLTTSLWPAEPGAERVARALLSQFQPGDRIAV